MSSTTLKNADGRTWATVELAGGTHVAPARSRRLLTARSLVVDTLVLKRSSAYMSSPRRSVSTRSRDPWQLPLRADCARSTLCQRTARSRGRAWCRSLEGSWLTGVGDFNRARDGAACRRTGVVIDHTSSGKHRHLAANDRPQTVAPGDRRAEERRWCCAGWYTRNNSRRRTTSSPRRRVSTTDNTCDRTLPSCWVVLNSTLRWPAR
jgi:hypothetical protein